MPACCSLRTPTKIRWMQPGPAASRRMLRPGLSAVGFTMFLKSVPSPLPPLRSQVLDMAVCDASSSGMWSTVRRRLRKKVKSRIGGWSCAPVVETQIATNVNPIPAIRLNIVVALSRTPFTEPTNRTGY